MSRKKTEHFGKNFARSQFSFINNVKSKRKSAYSKLKSLDFPDLCEAIDFLDKNVKEDLKQPLFGKALPISFEEIGDTEYPYLGDNIAQEINWVLVSIRKYTYQINLFLIYKDIYENNVLIGDYSEAEKYLTKIEEEICFSMWGLENRFLLNELKYSSSQNKELLIEFNKSTKGPDVLKSLAHYLSTRAEQTLSVKRFIADLDLALGRLDEGKPSENRDYYLFKLSFLNTIKFSYFPEILYHDFTQSVIDKYLSLRKILTSLFTSPNTLTNNIEWNLSLKNYVLNRINYLIRKIDDPVLYKLKLFGDSKLFPAFEYGDSLIQINLIDKFTIGLYEEVEKEAAKILLKKSNQFDLYLIYIEALVYQNKPFNTIGSNKSLQNQILKEIYRIVSVSHSPTESGLNLLRISNNLASNILSYGIIDFVFYQTKGQLERKIFARLSYSMANPNIYECFQEVEDQVRYLDFLLSKFPNSVTINFLKNKLTNIDSIQEYQNILPRIKYLNELAKGKQQIGDFSEAAKIWNEVIDEYSATSPVLETAILNLYQCYFSLKKYDLCITLYVNSYMSNNYIVEKIDPSGLLKVVNQNRFKVISATIEAPIFYSLVNADENETHTTFEKFNLAKGVLLPSNLLPRYKEFDKDKLFLYLRNTCGSEILKHSIHINGSKERLEERLTICQFLLAHDSASKLQYEEEIKTITNILIIQQGRIELDESKIYVNEQGIIQSELRDFEAIFSRFKTIAGIAKKSDNKVLLLQRGKLTTVNLDETEKEKQTIEYSTNPVFDIYVELFDAIKVKFLYSKFGIVAYLSTRIRHGVLLGELRPIFERHRLITQKDGHSHGYRANDYWAQTFLAENAIVVSKMQLLLMDFSASVDGLIFDLIKKHLQVEDPVKNPDGWFNYDFTEDSLFWYSVAAIQSSEFSDFVRGVFELLWIRTDENLKKIRSKIQNDIADQFNELFNALETDILKILDQNRAKSLVTAIKACSTEVQTTIERISNWFKRSGTQLADFKLENLIDIVIGYSDKANRLVIVKDIQFERQIKGEFYTHFADLLRIFIENILKHADSAFGAIPVKISVHEIETEGLFHLAISNHISDLESVAALKHDWSNHRMDLDKLLSEGKSGYHKAHKILTSDLGHDDNKFGTKVNDQEQLFEVHSIIYFKELIK